MYLNENKNLLLRIIGLVFVIAVIVTIATAIGAVSAASNLSSPNGNDVNSELDNSNSNSKSPINKSVGDAENNNDNSQLQGGRNSKMSPLAGIAPLTTIGPQAAGVDTLYVSPNGHDTDIGTTSGSPLQTIAKALERINAGGTIYLMEGTHTEGFTGTGIPIGKNVNIIGYSGTVVLDAGKSGRHFNIAGANTVKFQNIQFINGNVSGSGNDEEGGAIFINNANAKVEIANVTFINNTATSVGGTICIFNGNVSISNSTFINNTGVYGGAIYISNGDVSISNCTFTNNTASNSAFGGAICIIDSNVTISNCTFINNTATGYYGGGAIYIEGGSLTIGNSTFINNTAFNGAGGAIYIRNGATVNITGSTFTSNEARNGHAGAIYIYASNVNITNSTFTNNQASSSTGAIYITSSGSNVNISYSRIYNNPYYQVYRAGGTVTANSNWWGNNTPVEDRDYTGDVTIENYFVANATFDGVNVTYRFYLNTSQDIDGSDLPAFDATISLGESIVDTIDARVSQTYTPSADDNIYTLSVDGYSMTFQRYDVLYVDPDNGNDSYAGTSTGTALATITKALELINAGGTIYLMDGTHTDGFTGQGIGISKNVNIIGVSGANVILDARKDGRHFIIAGAYTVKFQNIQLANGNTSTLGGAIRINNANAKVEIANVTFTNNTAIIGGAIHISNGNVNISHSTFTNNTVASGGVIFIVNSNVTISNCTFTNNTATTNAGAIGIEGGSVNITNSTFTNNTASYGGAICISDSSVNISNCRIYNNSDSQVHVYDGTVTANSNWWGNNIPTSPRDYTVAGGTMTIANWFVANATFDGTNLNYRFYLSSNQSVDGSDLPVFDVTISLGGNIVETRDARVSHPFTPRISGDYTLSVDDYLMTFEATVIPHANMSVGLSTGGKRVIEVGDTFNLLVTVTNLGPDKSSFVFSVEIPKGMKFISAKATHGTVTFRDGAVYWEVSNLEPKYIDLLLNPAGDLAPYQALLDITLKVLKSGKFAFKYNVEGINTVVNVKGDTKLDLIAIKKNGTDNNDINKNKINKTKYKHGHSGMMKTGVLVPIDSPVPTPIPVPTDSPVPIVIIVLIAILALIAMFFIVIGLRRRN